MSSSCFWLKYGVGSILKNKTHKLDMYLSPNASVFLALGKSRVKWANNQQTKTNTDVESTASATCALTQSLAKIS